MITITNWWGVFFSFYIPIVLAMVGSYYAGIEKAKNNTKKSSTTAIVTTQNALIKEHHLIK